MIDCEDNIHLVGSSYGRMSLKRTSAGTWDGVIMKLDASEDEL